MKSISIFLILFSALIHAYWNFKCKQVKDKEEFIALFKFFVPIIIFPYILFNSDFNPNLSKAYPYIITSGLISFAGFYTIAKVYDLLNFSIAYPITRSRALFCSNFCISFNWRNN